MYKNLIYFIVILFFLVNNSYGNMISLARDAEIEGFIKELSEPILKTAGIDYRKSKIFIVMDKNINAFVINNSDIFIHSGLIENLVNTDMITGVLAHEIGHISLKHVTKQRIMADQAKYTNISTILLGAIGSIFVTPMILPAVFAGIVQNNIGNIRAFEKEADFVAIDYLEKNSIAADGLIDTFKLFQKLEGANSNPSLEYLRTHPLNENRINSIESGKKKKYLNNTKYNKKYEEKLEFIKIKLAIFEGRFKNNYPVDSIYFNYANSIIFTNAKNCKNANIFTNILLQFDKNNPYFLELVGEASFVCGNFVRAIEYLEKADDLVENDLFKILIATIIIQNNLSDFYAKAEENLYNALYVRESPEIWRMLGGLYFKKKMMFEYYISLSNFYKNTGKKDLSQKFLFKSKELKDTVKIKFLLNYLE